MANAIKAEQPALVGRFFQDPGVSFFLFGPRGTGKSTWLKEKFKDALWLDLLDPEKQRSYLARPERLKEFVAGHPPGAVVVIDEVQKAPILLDVVHAIIESTVPMRFILTGSSARKLKGTGVDLLAGRAVLRRFHPFMAGELGTAFDLAGALRHGLVPIVWNSPRPVSVLETYVALYIQEEVKAEGLVRNLGSFSRFVEATTFSHAAVLNVTEVASQCQVSRKAVASYFEILEDLLLVFRVPVFARRAKRQLASHPKFFWFDPGVFRSIRPQGPLDSTEEVSGAGIEGLVAQHLRAWIDYSDSRSNLFYWRTKSGNEVDLVVYGESGFWAFEVKHASTIRSTDLRGLKAFREDYPEAIPRVLYRGSESLEIDGIRCVPCTEYLRRVVPGRPLP